MICSSPVQTYLEMYTHLDRSFERFCQHLAHLMLQVRDVVCGERGVVRPLSTLSLLSPCRVQGVWVHSNSHSTRRKGLLSTRGVLGRRQDVTAYKLVKEPDTIFASLGL